MTFLQEAVNDFYRGQTFYNLAKKNQPELKKLALAFMRKHGVEGHAGYFNDKHVKYDDLKTMPKDARRARFRKVMDDFEIEKDFFTVGKTYSGIKFGKFFYKNNIVDIKIKSNETFYESGHDLEISLRAIDSEEHYSSGKLFKYKVNLMQPVDVVMKSIWANLDDAIKKLSLPEEEKSKETKRQRRRYVKSDITRIVQTYLDKQYKIYKNGTKKELEWDKKLVDFNVSMNSGNNKTYDSAGRGQDGFTLRIKVNKLKTNTKKIGSGYRSRTVLKPELAAKFPDYEKWIDILREGKKEMGGSMYYNIEWLFGKRTYGDEHLALFKRLQMVTRKFIKLGYLPLSSHTPYKQGESATIEFKKDPDLVSRIEKDPGLIDRIMNNKKYSGNLKKAFFYNGGVPDDVYKKCLDEVFSWKK